MLAGHEALRLGVALRYRLSQDASLIPVTDLAAEHAGGEDNDERAAQAHYR